MIIRDRLRLTEFEIGVNMNFGTKIDGAPQFALPQFDLASICLELVCLASICLELIRVSPQFALKLNGYKTFFNLSRINKTVGNPPVKMLIHIQNGERFSR